MRQGHREVETVAGSDETRQVETDRNPGKRMEQALRRVRI